MFSSKAVYLLLQTVSLLTDWHFLVGVCGEVLLEMLLLFPNPVEGWAGLLTGASCSRQRQEEKVR